jgi:ParB-like chromosome segregation protein Spo0J
MSDTRTLISLSQLRADEDYQPRLEGLRESHIRLLMASDPATWAPLLVAPSDEGTFTVIDGFHRLEAATRLGLTALSCVVDPRAGYPEAVAANLRHGLPLALADRKAFARWLADEEPGLSYRELGRRCGLNHETVKRAPEEEE